MEQKEIPLLGALYEIACRLMFLIGGINYLMISYDFYESHQNAQNFFRHYLIMLSVINLIALFFAWLIFKYFIPSHIGFMARQNVVEHRNPMNDVIMEMHRDIKELKELIQVSK